MAKNKAKFASKSRKSALRIEALEQRQLLAAVTGGGTEVGSNIVHPNGNVYDQVLMTGASVTVTADAGQVTRVSFLDLSGDIVQAEFSGKGTLSVSLDSFSAAAEAAKYNQPGIKYVSGLASFTIQGEDASTNFSVFSVGSGNAVNQNLFAGGKTGGNNYADVARLLIVADPQNPGGFSTMGGIRAGNALFSDTAGVVGISATNVNVQGPVIVGDIDATNAGVPSLNFGGGSQFATLTVTGGDLLQTNAVAIVGGGFSSISSTNGTTSAGTTVRSQVISAAATAALDANPNLAGQQAVGSQTLDSTTTFDLTNMTQADISNAFAGRTFSSSITINGDLGSAFTISMAEVRGNLTFNGAVSGAVTVSTGNVGNVTFAKGLGANFTATVGTIGDVTSTGNVTGTIRGAGIGNVSVTGNLTAAVSSDANNNGAFDTGEKAVGKVNVTGNVSGRITGVLGIGDVTIGGNLTGGGGFTTLSSTGATSGDSFSASIGKIAVAGDLNLSAGGNLIAINRGTFGDITVGGAGTLNNTDVSVANNIGNIVSFQGLTAKSGSITVTDTASLTLGLIQIANPVSGASTLGDITLTSGSKAQTTNSLGATVAGNFISTTGSAFSGSSFATSAITLSGAEKITLNALTARVIGSVSATTIATANANITLNPLSTSNAAPTTSDTTGTIALRNDYRTLNGSSSVGAVTLNASTSGSITWNGDVGGASPTTQNMVPGGGVAPNTTAVPFTPSNGTGAGLAGTTVGAVTVTAATTTFGANVGIRALGGLSSFTANGDVVFTAPANGPAAASATVSLAGQTSAAQLVTNPTFVANPNFEVGGTSGALTFNGVTTMRSSATVPTISGNNYGTGLDSIASITFNGRVIGGAATAAVAGTVTATAAAPFADIKASAIGDITVQGALSQGQVLVTNLGVQAVNISNLLNPGAAAGGANTANAATSEAVSIDGSNLGSYSLGNITVKSTNSIGVTNTQLFAGGNWFFGLGKMGNISLTGGGSPAVQTTLFGDTAAATAATDDAGVAFNVGRGDFALVPTDASTGIDLDGNGVIGSATLNTNYLGAAELASTAGGVAFTQAVTATMGTVSINAAAGATNDSLQDVGGVAGTQGDGLVILNGVKGTGTGALDLTTGTLGRISNNLIGTIGAIQITNLNQQLTVSAAGVPASGFATGIIAAAGSTTTIAGTANNIGGINGVTVAFAQGDRVQVGNDGAAGATIDEIVIVRV